MTDRISVASIIPFWRYAVGPTNGSSAAIPYYRLASAEAFFAEAKRDLPWSNITLWRRVWPMQIEPFREYHGTPTVGVKPMDDAQTDAPLPCPFCGDDALVQDWGELDAPIIRVCCAGTKGLCPCYAFVSLEVWNSRAALASPRAPESSLNPLEQFALWALTELREHGSDIDGGDAQEKLAEFGVVQMVEVTEQCHTEDCPCAEFGFPTQCYRDSAFTAQRRAGKLSEVTPSPDWRDSEAVKQARSAVIRAAEEWEGNPHGADTHDALDALCDAVAEYVQSHARPSKGE